MGYNLNVPHEVGNLLVTGLLYKKNLYFDFRFPVKDEPGAIQDDFGSDFN